MADDQPPASADSSPRYISVANEIAAQITSGQLGSGARVPSVRLLAQQRRLSPTTALAALRHLERRGYIEARPQSGYYVRLREPAAQPLRMSRTAPRPQQVRVNSLFSHLVRATASPTLVPLGSAVPQADWFPVRGLQRALAEAMRRHPQALTEYGHAFGLEALRRGIARRYADLGCEVDADEVLITDGCMEALNLALRAVARPGDVIAVESPTFFGFLQVIESLGMKALEIATHPRDGLSVPALAEALTQHRGEIRALLLSVNINNPFGATMPDEQKRALLRLCARHRLPIIEDEVYADLHFGAQRPAPLRAYGGEQPPILLCSSFSKTLAPGMRVGWILGGTLIEPLRLAKFTSTVATPMAMQQAIAEFLDRTGYQRHLRGLRQASEAQLGRFSEAVQQHFPAGTRIAHPQGGFVLWVELPSGADSLRLHERALAEGISFAPGPLFSPSGRYRNALRLNCGRTMTPQVERALRRLGELAAL